nr:cell wall anchor protein [Staphylococcus hominis]
MSGPYSIISSTGSFVISSVGSPSPTFSPVNGFFVVGVVIVFSPFSPFCTTFSVPGARSGLNSRFLSNGISSFSMIGSPSTGPYFVTSSTGGVTTSPVSGFLIPGLPGTSSSLPFGAFGSNSSL